MIYGYARVSTKGQALDGNSLEAQERELKAHGAKQIFFDSFTGTKRHRPELDKLLALLQPGDTLIVTKLDRVARSTIQGIGLIDELFEKGVTVHILNMGVMNSTPTGRLMRTIMLAFAEFERDMIVERTSEGKEVAKAKNPSYREGRKAKRVENLQQHIDQVNSGAISLEEKLAELNISRSTWYNLKRRASA